MFPRKTPGMCKFCDLPVLVPAWMVNSIGHVRLRAVFHLHKNNLWQSLAITMIDDNKRVSWWRICQQTRNRVSHGGYSWIGLELCTQDKETHLILFKRYKVRKAHSYTCFLTWLCLSDLVRTTLQCNPGTGSHPLPQCRLVPLCSGRCWGRSRGSRMSLGSGVWRTALLSFTPTHTSSGGCHMSPSLFDSSKCIAWWQDLPFVPVMQKWSVRLISWPGKSVLRAGDSCHSFLHKTWTFATKIRK